MAQNTTQEKTSFLQPVEQTVKLDGLTMADTGLGTTYERWALNQLLDKLFSEIRPTSILEGPGDGMTGISGINSLLFGLKGVPVTLVLDEAGKAEVARQAWAYHAPQADFHLVEQTSIDTLPFPDRLFDLVWNFNVMTRQQDPLSMLEEMKRVSRRYVLIFVPNRRNYAFGLHRFHHRVSGEPWDHGQIDLMGSDAWLEMLDKLGLRVRQTVWVDCPWWPDIINPAQMLADFFPFLRKWTAGMAPERRYSWKMEDLPYYLPERYPEVHQQMERLAYFERSRLEGLKKRFAHHVGVLAEKG